MRCWVGNRGMLPELLFLAVPITGATAIFVSKVLLNSNIIKYGE